MPMVKNS